MGDKKKAASVVRSYADGHVSLKVSLTARSFCGDAVSVQGAIDLTTAAARELASDLIRVADEADAKITKKAAAKERREKWREREIAAGRIKIMTASSFFGRRDG